MSNLRNKIIRLAHSKPELRKHLLPLLKEKSMKLASSKHWNVVWVRNYDKSLADRIKKSSAGKEYALEFEGVFESTRKDAPSYDKQTQRSKETLTYAYKTNMEFAPKMWEYLLIDVTKEERYSVQVQHESGTWTYDSEGALLGNLSKILEKIKYKHGL